MQKCCSNLKISIGSSVNSEAGDDSDSDVPIHNPERAVGGVGGGVGSGVGGGVGGGDANTSSIYALHVPEQSEEEREEEEEEEEDQEDVCREDETDGEVDYGTPTESGRRTTLETRELDSVLRNCTRLLSDRFLFANMIDGSLPPVFVLSTCYVIYV